MTQNVTNIGFGARSGYAATHFFANGYRLQSRSKQVKSNLKFNPKAGKKQVFNYGTLKFEGLKWAKVTNLNYKPECTESAVLFERYKYKFDFSVLRRNFLGRGESFSTHLYRKHSLHGQTEQVVKTTEAGLLYSMGIS